jgi:hypothetical protein
LAIVVSIWLNALRSAVLKIAVLALLALFLIPNLHADFWSKPNSTPSFFTRADYLRYLQRDENVIGLPYGISGTSMLWQATAGFYFRMAGGWTSVTPREFQRWPIVGSLLTTTYIADAPVQLRAFMAAHDVRAVIVDDREVDFWAMMLSPLDPAPVRVSGVTIYRPPPADLEPYRRTTALEMERRNDEARFTMLLRAAYSYLAENRDVTKLTPMRTQQLGLLPPCWVKDSDVRTNNGLYLGPWSSNRIALGVVGTYEALQPLIAKYDTESAQVFFPFPRQFTQPLQGDTFMRLLVMVFDRQGLMRAATANARAN